MGAQSAPPAQSAKLRLEVLPDRIVPALFAVQLLGSSSGIEGDTAATISGSLALNSQLPVDTDGAVLVEANTASEAVASAITGSIAVSANGQNYSYTIGSGSFGAGQALRIDGCLIELEDLAAATTGCDFDYNDWYGNNILAT